MTGSVIFVSVIDSYFIIYMLNCFLEGSIYFCVNFLVEVFEKNWSKWKLKKIVTFYFYLFEVLSVTSKYSFKIRRKHGRKFKKCTAHMCNLSNFSQVRTESIKL